MPSTDNCDSNRRLALLKKLRSQAVGLDTEYTVVNGRYIRRVYLDSTATTLRLKVVQDAQDRFQAHYANPHTAAHFAAKISTREYLWVHDMVLNFVRADPDRYTAFFVGSGTTAGMNRVARTLRERRPTRDMVICSIMEHHSNDLPHRKNFREVIHVPTGVAVNAPGAIDLKRLEQALHNHPDRINYVAITGVSNVTGIINPVHQVAVLAHRHGALVVVDGAQMVAHLPVQVSGHEEREEDLDVLVFSGHKVYAPGSPGVVVTRKDLFAGLEPQELGGGVVDRVYVDRYTLLETFPEREEAGTPNVTGAIGLGASLYALSLVGMDLVADEERALVAYALEELLKIDDVIVYGETDQRLCPRAGSIAFNVRGVDHGLVAVALNDYFNIATRNECFCAHPYVRDMIIQSVVEGAEQISEEELAEYIELRRGMVRASFAIYNTRADVDALADALRHIVANRSTYEAAYLRQPNGDYLHRTFDFDPRQAFSVTNVVDRLMTEA